MGGWRETLSTLCVEADGGSLDDTPRWKLVTWLDLISETLVTWLDLISETLQTLCVEADGTSLDDTPRWKLVTWGGSDK
jgi:hypothetical protein